MRGEIVERRVREVGYVLPEIDSATRREAGLRTRAHNEHAMPHRDPAAQLEEADAERVQQILHATLIDEKLDQVGAPRARPAASPINARYTCETPIG